MSPHNLPSPARGGGQVGGLTLIPMARQQISPYGSWRSPVTADAIVAGVIGLSQIQLDGDDIYWVEGRPAEAGRNVIVRRRPDGITTDITPPEYNARTRVHEYGGGAYLVRDGVGWFTNFKDQRLYRQDPGRPPVAIPPPQAIRHADIVFDHRHQRLIAIREDHTTDMPQAVNTIVSFDPTGKIPAKTLVQANDFYSSPRVSPSGTHLSWLTWNHPNMPWDGTELWVAELTPDGLRALRKVAGGEGESIFQPTWSPDGMLYFVLDRTNWWNLYRWRGPTVEPVTEVPSELGTAQWTFGMSTYAFESERRIVCQVRSQGVTRLATVDLQAGGLEPVATPFTAFSPYIQARAGNAYTIAGSPTETMSVVAVNLETGIVEVLRRSAERLVDPTYISVPEAIEFPPQGGVTAHGFFYRPVNPEYSAPAGERPPGIVYVHRGATSPGSKALHNTPPVLTTPGFAHPPGEYRGSTRFARAYPQRPNSPWGGGHVAH